MDYNETFSPVSRQDTVRIIVTLSTQRRWKIYQFDVKSPFLNEFLQEEIYIEQPLGFEIKGKEDNVLRFKKRYMVLSKLLGHGIVGLMGTSFNKGFEGVRMKQLYI